MKCALKIRTLCNYTLSSLKIDNLGQTYLFQYFCNIYLLSKSAKNTQVEQRMFTFFWYLALILYQKWSQNGKWLKYVWLRQNWSTWVLSSIWSEQRCHSFLYFSIFFYSKWRTYHLSWLDGTYFANEMSLAKITCSKYDWWDLSSS